MPLTLVAEFLVDTADPADGEADAPVGVEGVVDSADSLNFWGNLDEELTLEVVAVPAAELVEEMVVRDKVLESNLPFGDSRTPVPLLQQLGELSQQ